MKKLYFIYLEDGSDYDAEDVGEVEGAFDEEGKLLGAWCCNDATWRGEYFSGFMYELGFDIQGDPSETQRVEMEKALVAYWS